MADISKLEEIVKDIEEKVNKNLFLDEWKFKQDIEGGEKVDIDEKGWEEKVQPINWALKDGDAYFRRWFTIPEEIEGIKIEGSKVFLKFLFVSGVTLYINGKEIYSHKFWADKIATPVLLAEKAKPGDKILIVFKTNMGDGLGYFWAKISIKNIDEKIFQLKSLLYQIKFAQILCEEFKIKKLKNA